MRSIAAGVVLVLASAAAVSAQGQLEQKLKREAEEKQMFLFQPRVPLERTVKAAPYSAEVVIETNQALADGNRISRRTTGRVYRDSEGRTRREEDRQDGTVGISIVDPVAAVSYALDPEQRIAWQTSTEASFDIMKKMEAVRRQEREGEAMRKREAETAAAAVAAGRIERSPAAESHTEGPLERKVLEGVPVEGRRNTTTIRAGAIGNDLPIVITSEEWSSPDLKVLVMTRRNDPRNGETTYRLTNIVRGEPDSSLFQVPPGFTVRETGIRRPAN
jgi:hypothetical protein